MRSILCTIFSFFLAVQLLGQVMITGNDTLKVEGNTVVLTVKKHEGALQWQKSRLGSSWIDMSGQTGDTLKMEATGNEAYYRAKATNGYCVPSYSEVVRIVATPSAVATDSAWDKSSTGFTVAGTVSNAFGVDNVLARGFFWSNTNIYPDESDNMVVLPGGTGSFSKVVTGLTPGLKYYVRAFVMDNTGTMYGQTLVVTTLEAQTKAPSVTSMAATSVTDSSAVLKGSVAVFGNTTTITSRGFYWSRTNTNPTSNDNVLNTGNGPGIFTSTLYGLDDGTTYYFRAFATYSGGSIAGETSAFTTGVTVEVAPEVSTYPATAVTETTSSMSGFVATSGKTQVLQKGFYWSTENAEPTSNDSVIYCGPGSGALSCVLTRLLPDSRYYFRAFAIYSSATVMGNTVSFTTLTSTVLVPTITTLSPTAITDTSAMLMGQVVVSSGVSISDRGFFVSSTNSIPDASDKVVSMGSGTGNFSSSITGLEANTTYYVRAYASYDGGMATGGVVTLKASAPTVSAFITLGVPTSSAGFLYGKVRSSSATNITFTGFYYSTTNSTPGAADKVVYAPVNSGDFSATIDKLPPSTTYYVRSFAVFAGGTVVSDVLSFTTLEKITIAPVANTLAATSVSESTATINATIASEEEAVIDRGFFVSSTNVGPGEGDIVISLGSGTGYISTTMTNLNPQTTYYFRAFARHPGGTVTGNILTFTTAKKVEAAPVVTTIAASDISQNTATINGEVTAEAGTTVLLRGFYYSSTNTNPSASDLTISAGNGAGNITRTLTSLIPSTTYYYRAFAIYADGTITSDVLSFTTSQQLTETPVVGTPSITHITDSSATLEGNVSVTDTTTITARGFYWSSTNPSPASADNIANAGSGTGSFTAAIKGLVPSTKYYVVSFVTYSGKTVVGTTMSFTSSPRVITPTVTTSISLGTLSETSVAVTATTETTNNPSIVRTGFYWSALNSNPTSADNVVYSTIINNSFSATITGLVAGTPYYVKAFAVHGDGTAESKVLPFATPAHVVAAPEVSTLPATQISDTSALINAIANSIEADVLGRGFYVSSSHPNPDANDKIVEAGAGVGSFTRSFDDLTPSTTYYFRAYATYSRGTITGSVLSFTTKEEAIASPKVTIQDATSVTDNSATIAGLINANTSVTIESRGFYISSSSTTPSATDLVVAAGSGTGSFSINIDTLQANTTYYACAFATYSGTTIISAVMSFTTLQHNVVVPVVSSLSPSAITDTSATFNGSVISEDAEIISRGFYWSTTNTNPGASDITATAGSGTGSFSANVAGLQPSTTYYLVPFANYNGGTVKGSVVQFTTSARALVLPQVITLSASDSTFESALINARIVSPDYEILTRGFYYSPTNQTPGINNRNVEETSSETGVFSMNITGLRSATLFYCRSFVTYSGGTIWGNVITVTTKTAPPSVTTLASWAVTHKSATIAGRVTVPNGATVLGYGFYWSDTSPKPSNAHNVVSLAYTTNNFSYNFTELSPSTTYYFKAFAQHADGIIEGDVMSFSTPAAPAIPEVTTLVASDTTTTSATLNGIVSIADATEITARGFYWSATNPIPSATDNIASAGSGTGNFATTISDLTENTSYYAVAFATYEGGTITGEIIQFQTLETIIVPPVVATLAQGVVTDSSAVLNGSVSVDTSTGDIVTGFFLSTVHTSPSSSDTVKNVGTSAGSFTITFLGLKPSTTYYARAFSVYSGGIVLGDVVSFVTPAHVFILPEITSTDASDITDTSAVLHGSVVSTELEIIENGFFYSSTNQDPGAGDERVALAGGTGDFSTALSALNPSSTYYYRAYSTCLQDTVWGNVLSFTTKDIVIIPPVVSTETATSVTYNSATVSGSVDVPRGTTVIAYGFYFSDSNADPSKDDSVFTISYSTSAFTKDLGDLEAQTTYHFKAFAIYNGGIATGVARSFTTEAIPVIAPVVSTLAASDVSTASAQLNAQVESPQQTVIARGFFWSQTNSTPTSSDKILSDAGSGVGSFGSSLSGLAPSTTYYYVAYAVYGQDTAVGQAQQFTTQIAVKDLYIELHGTTITTNSTTAIVSGSRIAIMSAGDYKVSGTLDDGQIVVQTADIEDVTLTLSGVDITNTTGSAIYVAAASNANIVLADATTNSITDGSSYDLANGETEPNAAIFSKADLKISGTGSLIVDGNFENGITSKDELTIESGEITVTAAKNGIIGKDNIEILGGTITIGSGSDGIKSTNDSDPAAGYVSVSGGTVTVTAQGDGISAEAYFYLENATVDITAGGGNTAVVSDTLSHKGVKASIISIVSGTLEANAAGDALSSDGIVTITGGTLSLKSGDEAISAKGDVTLGGGDITIESAGNAVYSLSKILVTGGDLYITSMKDALNTKGTLDISGGAMEFDTQDQGVNADAGVSITGGKLTIESAFDAINSGKDITISQGTIILTAGGGCSSTFADTLSRNGIDAAGDIAISGGTFTIKAAGDGINAKGTALVSGGILGICAGDDGINGQTTTRVSGGTTTIDSKDKSVTSLSAIDVAGGSISANNSITSDGTLSVSDGNIIITIANNDAKAMKSLGDMTLGGGTITITTSGNATLVPTGSGAEPSYCTAIKCASLITISGSTIVITASGMGGKGISADADLSITGGSVSITTTGNGATYNNSSNAKDAYGSTCISVDKNLTITGGTTTLSSSGTAGKGISVDGTITIGNVSSQPIVNITTTGDAITVSTSGSGFNVKTDKSSAKAIKGTGAVVINNGTVSISSADDGVKSEASITINGGEFTISKSLEGLEAPFITMNGGVAYVTSSNDGINATYGTVNGGSNSADGSLFSMTGGKLVTAGADAIDSNGDIVMTGGVLISEQNSGFTGPEEGIDFNGTFKMNGGYCFSPGGNSFMIQAMSASSSQHNLLLSTTTMLNASTLFHIRDANGNDVITFRLTYGGYKFLFSSSLLKNGSSYTLYTGGSYNGGTEEDGICTGGTYSGGSSKKTFTISSITTNMTF